MIGFSEKEVRWIQVKPISRLLNIDRNYLLLCLGIRTKNVQDQLQMMLSLHWADTYFRLSDWLENLAALAGEDYSPGRLFYSWEQLWLAFVMKELYGKRWNGSDWEVDNN